MTFYEYMMTRTEEDTPIGDLARDIREDDMVPKTDKHLDIIRYFMLEKKLKDPARRALTNAWRDYKKFDQIECRVRIALQECRARCSGYDHMKFKDFDLEQLSVLCAKSIMDIEF